MSNQQTIKRFVHTSFFASAGKVLIGAIGVVLTLPTNAQDSGQLDEEALQDVFPARPYSPYAGRNYPTRPLFGDTHLHTSYSMDGGAAGARLGPRDAYRFAKGGEITASSGQQARLSRPLDFLVVADHSDGLGFFPLLFSGDPRTLATPQGRKWYDMIQEGQGVEAALDIYFNLGKGTIEEGLLPVPGTPAFRDAWQQTIDAAEEANDPGRFTAFIGFEWTSGTGGNNLHRNVIFRDDGSRAAMVVPFTAQKPLGSDDPRALWEYMARYEEKTGGNMLAIAHNGNGSNGRMFPVIESFTGKPIDRAYAESRRRWEPLYEVTQMKGTSEAHPFLSPNDEFAAFEIWDKGNLDVSAAKKPEMLEFEYARSAFRTGLALEEKLGINPYKFGLVGSTDAHTALAAVEEDNFFGKTSGSEPSATRADHPFLKNPDTGITIMGWETAASGYAAVWATDNTREAIFDAMERRETYATTGSRIVVRFFGGWDFEVGDAGNRLPAQVGYTKGVPMGGDLSAAPAGKAPSFLIAALKDPIGANLDRIQVIKGWLDAEGETHEQVYDVAWSDSDTRKPGADGKLPAVGSSVDVANASWTNTIGDSELIAVWTDPDFDPEQSAFYYARILEIPTPRWTAYDAKFFGIDLPDEVPMVQQERAYTSPIWYTP
jgi:hypothetical protein